VVVVVVVVVDLSREIYVPQLVMTTLLIIDSRIMFIVQQCLFCVNFVVK
jgi:hypothetical protein